MGGQPESLDCCRFAYQMDRSGPACVLFCTGLSDIRFSRPAFERDLAILLVKHDQAVAVSARTCVRVRVGVHGDFLTLQHYTLDGWVAAVALIRFSLIR